MWRDFSKIKKILAQEVRQKSDILDRRRPLLYLQHNRWVTVQPDRVILH